MKRTQKSFWVETGPVKPKNSQKRLRNPTLRILKNQVLLTKLSTNSQNELTPKEFPKHRLLGRQRGNFCANYSQPARHLVAFFSLGACVTGRPQIRRQRVGCFFFWSQPSITDNNMAPFLSISPSSHHSPPPPARCWRSPDKEQKKSQRFIT